MTFDLTQLSPRGWAIVIIAAGSAIAVPFMKGGKSSQHAEEARDTSAKPAYSSQIPQEATPGHANVLTQSAPLRSNASFQLPPPGSIPSPSTQSSPQIAAPEFPDWARKPSPLDSLIEAPSHSSSAEAPETPIRKPTPFRTWSSEAANDDNLANASTKPIDRHSPFSENGQPKSGISPELAKVAWPDQGWAEQRTAESNDIQPRPSTALVRTQNTMDGVAAFQFQSGPTPEGTPLPERKAVGASLRSNVVPSRELFISQPGLSKH